VLEKWEAYKAAGESPIPALHLAADDVLDGQTEQLALQRRIATDMRDIWAMQPRFERRVGKSPYKVLEHPRLRAGYDFLLLRCASGEIDESIGEWWTDFMEAEGPEREQLLAAKSNDDPGSAPKRRRRRGGRGRSSATGEE
jgi:poly(A) polymerase